MNKNNINSFAQNIKVVASAKSVKLDASKPKLIGEDTALVPMHIARTGTFSGYRDGEFTLTPEMFNQCIANFEAEKNPLPVYKGHADANGSITGEEPPASGWILGMKQDEEGNLFALVELTQEMQDLIKAGSYKFTSIYMKSEKWIELQAKILVAVWFLLQSQINLSLMDFKQ